MWFTYWKNIYRNLYLVVSFGQVNLCVPRLFLFCKMRISARQTSVSFFFLVSWYLYLYSTAFLYPPLMGSNIFTIHRILQISSVHGDSSYGKWQFTWIRTESTHASSASFLWNPGKNGNIKVMESVWRRVEQYSLWQLKSFKTTKDVTWSPSCKVIVKLSFLVEMCLSGSIHLRFH